MSEPSKARIKACLNQCRIAGFINGKSNCIIRDENSPGCPCESFGDCYLGLHKDPKAEILWKWYDPHDYFPDWNDFYLDLVNE